MLLVVLLMTMLLLLLADVWLSRSIPTAKSASDGKRSPVQAFVAEVGDEVVGVCILSESEAGAGRMAALRESFDVDVYGGALTSPGSVCVLTHFVISASFVASSRDIIRHALRQYGRKTTVLFRLQPGDGGAGLPAVPACIDDFVQVSPRYLHDMRPGELPVVFKPDGAPVQLTLSQSKAVSRSGDHIIVVVVIVVVVVVVVVIVSVATTTVM